MKALVDTFTQEMALVIVKSLRTFVCSSSVDGDGWCKSSITLIIVTNNPAPAPGSPAYWPRECAAVSALVIYHTVCCIYYIIVHGADMLPMFDITLLGKQGLFGMPTYFCFRTHFD